MIERKRSSFAPIDYVVYTVALALLLVAFFLRLQHLLARFFHVDEFITMLAMQMTALKGAPVLPSGVLYSQGLLLSYLAAPFVWLSRQPVEELLRWPSLLAGTLAVAGYYRVGRRLFGSPAVGLLVLALATFDGLMIVWSGRARMYALAGLFVLATTYFLLQGTIVRPRFASLLLAALCFLGAMTSHAVVIVLLPPAVVAMVVVLWLGRRSPPAAVSRPRVVWWQWLLIAGLVLLAVTFGLAGQLPFLSPESGPSAAVDSGGGSALQLVHKFLDPGLSWQRVDDYIYYYTAPAAWPLTALGGLALLLALLPAVRRRAGRRDLVTLFLGLLFLLTLAELSLMLPSTWRKSRYLFIVCQVPWLLLAADGAARLGERLGVLTGLRRPAWSAAGLLAAVALVVVWQLPAFADFVGSSTTGGYDTAFRWLAGRLSPDQSVMTVHPSAAYLYLGRSDYYASQKQARLVMDEDSEEPVDRYIGSQLVDSVDSLDRLLAEQRDRLWFVVDQVRLFKRYEPLFSQQVLAQMERVYETGGVEVFRGRPYPRPVPVEPPQRVQADFGGLIRLDGYSLDLETPAPDGTLQLVLYWHSLGMPASRPYKVFVQLRNERGDTLAQADHFIWQGLLTNEQLLELAAEQEWLRDAAYLQVPPALPPGHYRLVVGLYDPVTLERVPVVADRSGENAVILEEWSLP